MIIIQISTFGEVMWRNISRKKQLSYFSANRRMGSTSGKSQAPFIALNMTSYSSQILGKTSYINGLSKMEHPFSWNLLAGLMIDGLIFAIVMKIIINCNTKVATISKFTMVTYIFVKVFLEKLLRLKLTKF